MTMAMNPPHRTRKPNLTAALRQATKAGKKVKRVEIAADGSLKLIFIDDPENPDDNPWLAKIRKL
jgi:hypothetical protein